MARVALVTGGIRGIGAAIARALQTAGYRVAVTFAGNTKAADAFHAETAIPVFQWDVGDFAACATGVKQVEAALGPIDVLVNNAGIVRDSALHKMAKEQWDMVVNTDLNALFNMCRPVIEGMRSRRFGRIINISSINGQKGQFGQTNYAAAKAGELGFTRALALENARAGITVNAICPGYTHTEMLDAVSPEVMASAILPQIPVGRLGRPEEIARAVVFLAADDAGFITGSTLSINGGQYMS
ncbi:MAG TPA: acetoacetyl-CoA reductase [Bradyrhizobium sp.]|uniref:acetoacetyl-CoA reductase n=1 Tax=Bradyrhizobium sp. TaxID=376 RepID=UPI002B675AAA|nr:acetoacetyl-CoA reductase [Bradyrhizobium sp.]HLZ01052.1 acetoacetyl-CoA reductase [Bradyrhizobium sp.]